MSVRWSKLFEATDNDIKQKNFTSGWIRPDRVYGLVHMAKTAGSEINGELANHFERVCGNKGYSYDAFQTNARAEQFLARHPDMNPEELVLADMGDSVTKLGGRLYGWHRQNRGKVPLSFMDEIGYEDCDYIAQEMEADWWKQFSQKWKLELHIPCREPLGHLMSQCNGWPQPKTFKCADEDDQLRREIDKCAMYLNDRFDNTHLQSDPNITLKCFVPMPPSRYVDYMVKILQRKRIESNYLHRATNSHRNKSNECIWNAGEEFQQRVKSMLIEKFQYYQFCDECIGSANELPLSK